MLEPKPRDMETYRADFPILRSMRAGYPLVYLDSAATSQKPQSVIDAMNDYYENDNANVHRGVYDISERATAAYENARVNVALFINAPDRDSVVFTRNTTESINLAAQSWGRHNLNAGDAILVTEMEHHSNLVPWQMLAHEQGLRLLVIPVDSNGELDLTNLDSLLAENVKLVALTHVSNVLGTINPIAAIAARAHVMGAKVLVDGAQSVPHMPVDVQALDCDFLAFSAHKMVGPTGIGVLWAKRDILDGMPPFLGGGSMIKVVTMQSSTFADIPQRFEAGTPAIAEAVGFGASIHYLNEIGMQTMYEHELQMGHLLRETLGAVTGVRVHGRTNGERTGTVSFSVDSVHPHDVASLLNEENIAVRAGHHCCQPLMRILGVSATTRASAYVYTTTDEITALGVGLERVKRVFRS